MRTKSKWLNAISISTPLSLIDTISKLDGVRHVDLVTQFTKETPQVQIQSFLHIYKQPIQFQKREEEYSTYLTQLQQINVLPVHQQGNAGQNVLILVLDSGTTFTLSM